MTVAILLIRTFFAIINPIAFVFSRDAKPRSIALKFPFETIDARAILFVPVFQWVAVISSVAHELGRDAKAVVWTVELSGHAIFGRGTRLAKPNSYE